jgi:multidrug efflux pump subunit AcrA (membrane-fusion protein)
VFRCTRRQLERGLLDTGLEGGEHLPLLDAVPSEAWNAASGSRRTASSPFATETRPREAGLLEARETRRMAQVEVERASAVVELRTIRSPIDGIVLNRLLSPGDLADPPQLIELVEIDPLYVEVFAPLSAWGKIAVGATAEISPEEPVGGHYEARVSVVDRVIDPTSGTFRVRLELANPDARLPAGLGCSARFQPASGADSQAENLGDVADDSPSARTGLAGSREESLLSGAPE